MARTKSKKKSNSGSKKGTSTEAKVAMGVGLTAASIAAIGGYFLYGSKNAAQNRKKTKSWMLKAKGEILETLEDMKDVTQDEYNTIVDAVTDSYKRARRLSAAELAAFTKEMQQHWKKIEKTAPAKRITSRARKYMKSTPKKTTRSSTKRKKKTTKSSRKSPAKKSTRKTSRKK